MILETLAKTMRRKLKGCKCKQKRSDYSYLKISEGAHSPPPSLEDEAKG